MDPGLGPALTAPLPAADRQSPLGPLARLIYGGLLAWFRLSGWRAEGRFPEQRKFVIIGASHTSNFDFIVFLGTIHALGRRVRFMGKHSLFRNPMGGFMRSLGGVPIDRSARQDTVSQIVDQFAAHDDFALIIAAEGTRSATTKWRTGFYQIALKAGVPIVCAGPDYPTKRGVIGPVIWPSGDYDTDMAPAFAFFRSLVPRHPARAAFPAGT
ncbi:MAG: lysophospholipid acyltransferase family protein [Sphingomicrobium sp.]